MPAPKKYIPSIITEEKGGWGERWPPRSCEGKCIDDQDMALRGLYFHERTEYTWVTMRNEILARGRACIKLCEDSLDGVGGKSDPRD